jgi:hypothetical protein
MESKDAGRWTGTTETERRAAMERVWAGRRQNAARRKAERLAAELRSLGWIVHEPAA